MTRYVTANLRPKPKVIITFLTVGILLSNCVTMSDTKTKKVNENDVLEAQMGVVANYLDLGKPDKAHAELRAMMRKNPNSDKLYNLMGLTFIAMHQPKIAENHFRRAIKINSEPAYYLNLSSAYIEQKKFDDAIKVLNRVIEDGLGSYPYPERIYHNLGLAYQQTKRLNLAAKFYKKGLAQGPMYYPTLLRLGEIYGRAKKMELSENYYTQAKESCSKCWEPVRILIERATARGDRKKAGELAREFLAQPDIFANDKAQALATLQTIEPVKSSR